MKRLRIGVIVAFVLTSFMEARSHSWLMLSTDQDSTRKSLPKTTIAKIGRCEITIKYHSPSVRGRTIWGGLVPYGEVWVTGAHMATSIEFSKDLRLEGYTIKEGKYALFTIPGKEEWTIIINKNWEQHLTDLYDAKEDVIRFTVKPMTTEKLQDRLVYVVQEDSRKEGMLYIRWEYLTIPLKLSTE